MLGDVDADLTRDTGDRPLEGGILEDLEVTAAAADRVMVVMAAGLDALIPGYPTGHLDPLQQAQLIELLQRPVDAGPADRGPPPPQLVLDLDCGDATVVAGKRFDHGRAGSTATETGVMESRECVLSPGGVDRGCHLNRS